MSKTDARKIDALDQWCLRMLLGIRWYQFVWNDDVWRLTKQPKLTAIIQSRRLTLFGHIMRMDDNADAKRILLASPPADWRRQPGRPRITWLSTIQQDLKHHLRSPKQQIWLRTALCGGWCMALRNRELHARNDDDIHTMLVSFLCIVGKVHYQNQSCQYPFIWLIEPISRKLIKILRHTIVSDTKP